SNSGSAAHQSSFTKTNTPPFHAVPFPVRALLCCSTSFIFGDHGVKRVLCLFLLVPLVSLWCAAQSQPNTENGVKSFGSYSGSDLDAVNLQNGNLLVHIPLFSYPQRGELELGYSL